VRLSNTKHFCRGGSRLGSAYIGGYGRNIAGFQIVIEIEGRTEVADVGAAIGIVQR
jgi:hypothetical protein